MRAVFVAKRKSDVKQIYHDLIKMHKNEDELLVISKDEFEKGGHEGDIVVHDVEGETQRDAIILDHAGNVERLGWPDDDLPTDLCNGDKTESQRQEENEKKKDKELKPKKCPDCHHLVEAKIFICPSCGHHFSRPSDVEVNAGELEKLDRIPPAVKAQWYSELLHYARGKGYSDGWASYKFKEKFKHWPKKKSNVVPCSPSPEVLGFIQHLNIKYSKRKVK